MIKSKSLSISQLNKIRFNKVYGDPEVLRSSLEPVKGPKRKPLGQFWGKKQVNSKSQPQRKAS